MNKNKGFLYPIFDNWRQTPLKVIENLLNESLKESLNESLKESSQRVFSMISSGISL